jgi:hypothetical protein
MLRIGVVEFRIRERPAFEQWKTDGRNLQPNDGVSDGNASCDVLLAQGSTDNVNTVASHVEVNTDFLVDEFVRVRFDLMQ